jgi:hypothetical protein
LNDLNNIALSQLDELIARYESVRATTGFHSLSFSDNVAVEFITTGMATISRIAGADSQFLIHTTKHLDQLDKTGVDAPGYKVDAVGGGLIALRNAIATGYLISFRELIHATLFSDFLEIANHLLSEGYKDAAATMIGGVLEEHLRKLCAKNGINTETIDFKGMSHPKKMETMNTELTNKTIYSKLDQKNVTAWADLRNKAAHGHYGQYSLQQVELLLSSIKDFIARYPA